MERKNQERGLDLQEFLNPKTRLSSFSTFFHILWLKRWRLLVLWLLLGLPAATFLAFYDIPRDYTATTYLRFPRVVGAEDKMARDVSLGEQESVVRLFLSQKVLQKTIEEMSLRFRIATKNVFQKHVIQSLSYGSATPPGRYRFEFQGDYQVKVRYKPWHRGVSYATVFNGEVGDKGEVVFNGARIQFNSPFLAVSKGITLDMILMDNEQALQDFSDRLKVEPLDKGQVTVNYGVTLEERDPYLVADIVNRLTKNFIGLYSGTTEVQDQDVLARMQQNLEISRENLKKAQDRVAEFYRKNQGGLQVKEGNPYALASAQTQKAQLETNLERLTQSLDNKPGAGAGGEEKRLWISEVVALLSGQGVQRAEALRGKITELEQKRVALAAKYSPTHPFIHEADQEIAGLFEPVNQLATSAKRNYEGRLAQAGSEIARSLPGGGANMALDLEAKRLTEDRDNVGRILDNVQAEYDRAKLSAGPNLFQVSVIDPARPPLYEAPTLGTRLGFSAVAALLAFFPGFLAAMLAQILLPRIWNKDDAERKLKAKVLGSLFHIEASSKGPQPDHSLSGMPLDPLMLYFGGNAGPEDVEAYRSLRAEVEHFYQGASDQSSDSQEPPRGESLCLMVTSTHPGEGKSQVAANLAISFSRRGKRTLLIDSDFRHGRLERMFGYRPQQGLADLLRDRNQGYADFMGRVQEFVLPTAQPGLSLMPRGTYDEATTDGAYRYPMEQLLAAARAAFDVVILDAAPVIVTADPLNLVRMVGGVLFVIRSGHVSAREAELALEPLRDRDIPLAVVVNAILRSPADDNYFAKYGYYYHVSPAESVPVRTKDKPRKWVLS